jgi:hypothetical protein
VLGGGGITPDVEITGRALSENVALLYGNAAFFRFAVRLLQDLPDEQQAGFATSFEPDTEILDDFLTWVADEEILEGDQIDELRGDQQAMEDIALGLSVEVLNATLGLEAGYRMAIEGDDQIVSALEYLNDAADMWQVWQERFPGT